MKALRWLLIGLWWYKMGINKGYLTSGRTSDSDECLTPRYGVEPIIKHLKKRRYENILCPFDKEDSQYVRCLKREGFNVVFRHIGDGHDFFDIDNNFARNFDCIVSNPPFSCKDKVLRKLYEIEVPFAILLPQNSLQSISRVNLFLEHGIEYLGFDRRICFYTNGDMSMWKNGNHFASGYFCKDVLLDKLVFEKLNPVQEPY